MHASCRFAAYVGPGVVVCDGKLEDFGEYIQISVAEALLLMPLAYSSTGVLAAESSCLNLPIHQLNSPSCLIVNLHCGIN